MGSDIRLSPLPFFLHKWLKPCKSKEDHKNENPERTKHINEKRTYSPSAERAQIFTLNKEKQKME